MQAFVYKSLRKPDTYLYLRELDAFALLPEPVLAPLGQLAYVMELALTPERKLARVDAAVVRRNLAGRPTQISRGGMCLPGASSAPGDP